MYHNYYKYVFFILIYKFIYKQNCRVCVCVTAVKFLNELFSKRAIISSEVELVSKRIQTMHYRKESEAFTLCPNAFIVIMARRNPKAPWR